LYGCLFVGRCLATDLYARVVLDFVMDTNTDILIQVTSSKLYFVPKYSFYSVNSENQGAREVIVYSNESTEHNFMLRSHVLNIFCA
jgi:hypothetical protein